jgi:predicted 3-demethylubiquinone-9 3-methyltransferase (glyoxalase superfamily)
MPKITPCLWFDNNAEEAVQFYLSVFNRSTMGSVTRYGDAGADVSGRPQPSPSAVIRAPSNAAGSRTNTAYRGRSSRPC